MPNLKKLTFPGSLKTVDLNLDTDSSIPVLETVIFEEGVEEISEEAFDRFFSLKKIELPETVTYIGDGAFGLCLNLVDVNFPSNLEYIGVSAFSSNDIEMLKLPESVISLGESAFSGCSELLEVEIPGSINVIPKKAFNGCSNLQKVVIGDGVTRIDEDAFTYCNYIEELYIGDSVEYIHSTGFDSVGTVYTSSDSYAAGYFIDKVNHLYLEDLGIVVGDDFGKLFYNESKYPGTSFVMADDYLAGNYVTKEEYIAEGFRVIEYSEFEEVLNDSDYSSGEDSGVSSMEINVSKARKTFDGLDDVSLGWVNMPQYPTWDEMTEDGQVLGVVKI